MCWTSSARCSTTRPAGGGSWPMWCPSSRISAAGETLKVAQRRNTRAHIWFHFFFFLPLYISFYLSIWAPLEQLCLTVHLKTPCSPEGSIFSPVFTAPWENTWSWLGVLSLTWEVFQCSLWHHKEPISRTSGDVFQKEVEDFKNLDGIPINFSVVFHPRHILLFFLLIFLKLWPTVLCMVSFSTSPQWKWADHLLTPGSECFRQPRTSLAGRPGRSLLHARLPDSLPKEDRAPGSYAVPLCGR